MKKDIQISVLPSQFFDERTLEEVIREASGYPSLSGFILRRKSVDARRKPVRFILQVTVFSGETLEPQTRDFQWGPVGDRPAVVVVGAGPAGYFAALRLIELGLRPIVLERGREVSSRKRDVALLMRNQSFNPESNYCFGEGGAGTFSDGKLFTRSSKKGDIDRILQILCHHGAKQDILFEAHAHIGSDKLPGIMSAIRNTITDCGGEVRFSSKVSGILTKDNVAGGVLLEDGTRVEGRAVILATGHSAEDIYRMLDRDGIQLEVKPFAFGVRVEHPQDWVDDVQYHNDRSGLLPAASYNLVTQCADRGVYSFCMCPGGFMLPAGAQTDRAVVNGMSSSARHTPFANSGMVVELQLGDMGLDPSRPLSGLDMRGEIERMAFLNGGKGVELPAQRMDDFVAGRLSGELPPCSYIPGVISSPVHFWLPEFISQRLREGFKAFDRKMRGFISSDAIVVGVESRSSSPVRIPRDEETMQHPQIKGLFPCGEGAGYSGGITSSAMDGENCAEKVAAYL